MKCNKENKAGCGCGMLMLIWVLLAILVTIWTDRNLDFWISHIKGESVDIHWFWSFLLSLIGGWITIVGNIVAEIARAAM